MKKCKLLLFDLDGTLLQSACLAALDVEEETGKKLYMVDSRSASIGTAVVHAIYSITQNLVLYILVFSRVQRFVVLPLLHDEPPLPDSRQSLRNQPRDCRNFP